MRLRSIAFLMTGLLVVGLLAIGLSAPLAFSQGKDAPKVDPAKPEPAKPEPAKPEPAKPEPAKPAEPSKPTEPAKPAEPVKPSDDKGSDKNADKSLPTGKDGAGADPSKDAAADVKKAGDKSKAADSAGGTDNTKANTTVVDPSKTTETQEAKDKDSQAATPENKDKKDNPWSGVQETQPEKPVSLPTFLIASEKRLRDERPAPSDDQVQALREMQNELDRFKTTGGQYEKTVDAIVRREYLRQRREKDNFYGRQVRFEEKLQNEAREEAIKLFEKFIAKNPDHQVYTPDAMFRLGELYYERSASQYQARAQAAVAEPIAEDGAGQPNVDAPDFSPTIDLYHRLAQGFPTYRNLSTVYYLIGYCWNEMGQPDNARMAWLNLTCANHFHYDTFNPSGKAATPTNLTPEEQADAEKAKHPAIALDATPNTDESGPFVDPYQDCKAVQDDAQFLAETWLRIGEYHFDYDYKKYGLERAISAYNKLLGDPNDRNYNLALYKLAWTYYRASRYPEAIKHFGMLVDWSDKARKETGRAGSELRAEAVQYMGIAFAFDDWNENQVPDVQEGLPSGYERIQDPKLLPQDREWTVEIYQQLGGVHFDEAKYPDAIKIWELALSKWPNYTQAPEIQNQIAVAYSRANMMEESVLAKAKLTEYTEGSKWWNANLEHPEALKRAEELAENALIGTAVYHHRRAQDLRRRGVEEQDVNLVKDAQKEYGLAGTAYRAYLVKYPNTLQAYELRYDLADALFWSEDYEGAATEYAAVRDSNLDDRYLSESARRVVESLKRIIEIQTEAGKLEARKDPPTPQGSPARVSPVEMPMILQRMAQARETYLARVDDAHDTEKVRDSYEYNNALLLYQYGYWPQAKERFQHIFESRCKGALADESGRVAWLDLRNMAVIEENMSEVERLGKSLQEQQCTFGGKDGAKAVDCTLAKNKEEPQCLAGADLTNIKYARAVDVFAKAEKEKDEQKALIQYEEAATMLVKAVNEEPNHPQAPLALEKAAIALERTNRFESAGRLYQRIIDELGPRKAADAEDQQKLDSILSNAYFRLGFNANRFFDYDKAVQNYQTLADSKRFLESKDPQMGKRREDALINAATIMEYQQQYRQAAKYYLRAAEMLKDAKDRRVAKYRAAEMPYKEGIDPKAIRDLKAFIAEYSRDKEAADLVVLSYWRIAEITKRQGRDDTYKRALKDVVAAYASSGLPPGSTAAEYAGEANFTLVDEGQEEFEKLKIDPGKPKTLKEYVENVTKAIERAATASSERSKVYEPLMSYKRPKWTIAAFVRQGRIYEVLAKAVLNTPFVMPKDLGAQIQKAPPDAREEIRIQVEDRIRQVLDEKVRPIECLGVARYALASRASKAGSLDNEFTQIAADRLQAYGDERIAECVADAAKKDPSFGAYQQGEFSRSLRGKTRSMSTGVTAPPVTLSN